MSSETGIDDAGSPREEAEVGTIVLDGSQVAAMRRLMHELSNILTGVMISSGLLAQYLGAHPLRQYANGVCEGCERGCGVLRELRSQLLAACGEADAGAHGSSSGDMESPKMKLANKRRQRR